MGREIKRVPLDFNWPNGKVWDGYLNPHYRKCPDCNNGSTVAGEMLGAIVSLIMVAGEDAKVGPQARGSGRIWPHPYLDYIGCHAFISVSPDMAELSTGLAGREPSFMGHDCCDQWAATKKIIKAAGLNRKKWGICQTCKGDSIDPAIREQYEAWEKTEPPVGDGWQVWETVSEGSPVSPVFAKAEDLVEWLVGQGTSREGATAFVKDGGWVPSMVAFGGKIYQGIESLAIPLEEKGA
jgi:hypothetical protein